MVLLISLQIIVAHEFFLFKKFYLVMKGRKREIERERERERERFVFPLIYAFIG